MDQIQFQFFHNPFPSNPSCCWCQFETGFDSPDRGKISFEVSNFYFLYKPNLTDFSNHKDNFYHHFDGIFLIISHCIKSIMTFSICTVLGSIKNIHQCHLFLYGIKKLFLQIYDIKEIFSFTFVAENSTVYSLHLFIHSSELVYCRLVIYYDLFSSPNKKSLFLYGFTNVVIHARFCQIVQSVDILGWAQWVEKLSDGYLGIV